MSDSTNRKYDFRALKGKVGVTDVALALGYHVDRAAGVGRYVEMTRVIDGRKVDTLVISNPHNKGAQTFFRRNGDKGDALTLVREHLDEFNTRAKGSEWNRVGTVLSRLANTPVSETPEVREIAEAKVTKEFDAARYRAEEFNPAYGVPKILADRGIDGKTFNAFCPFVCRLYDLDNQAYRGYNVGFPYTEPGNDKVQGYEIRGTGGYKSKAAGTNSSSAAWIADFSGGLPASVVNVYFFESAFDAMAFHQVNHMRLDMERSVFVSVGGQMSDMQVRSILDRYPNAVAVDCYDNDIAGRIYGLRTACVAAGVQAVFSKAPEGVAVKIGEDAFTLHEREASVEGLGRHVDLGGKASQWKADPAFKDWNDVVLGNRADMRLPPNKFQRDEALARRRSGLKL